MLSDLNELKTFQRILALGSLSAAARDMGVGLAVVSKRLAALERRAGTRLVNRTTRRLSPTEDGLALLVHVERMLEALEAAEARLASGHDTPRGLLRVTAPVSFGRLHLAPVAADLVARCPELEIDLRLGDQIVDLIEGRIDVAVRIGALADSSAVRHKLADSRRLLAAAPAYLDRRGRPRTLDDLSRHDLLRYDDPAASWRLEGADGAAVEVPAPARLRADSGDVVHDWALAGHGIMLKSEIDLADDLAAGRLERVLANWRSPPAPIQALVASTRQLSGKARLFIAAVRERLSGAARKSP